MARIEIKADNNYRPRYKMNQEWEKDVKFNRHWYHLISLYDTEQFDFNQPLTVPDMPFDFNQSLFEY